MSRSLSNKWVIGLSFALALFASSQAIAQTPNEAQQSTIAQAKAAMNQGRPAEAYGLLAPLEDELAGNLDYDYLLGISALDSGKPDKATIAFERCLATDPNFAGARLDMARAYFQLRDFSRARSEFQTVLDQNPPDKVKDTVREYLAAIDAAERAQRRSIRAYVEYQLGYDTNVNNSTSQSIINVPALGNIGFTLSPSNLATRSSFQALGAGAELVDRVEPAVALIAGADWRSRDNANLRAFNAENYDYRAGILLGQAESQLRLMANYGQYYLDGNYNRHAGGLGGDYRYTVNPALQLNVFAQHGTTRFTSDANRVNSFDTDTGGIGALHILNEGRTAVFWAVFLGQEHDVGGRADGSKGFYGGRVGSQYKIREDLDLYGLGSLQHGQYNKQNAAFLATRKDTTWDLSVGLNWRFANLWTLRPQVLIAENRSNIPIYPFHRTEYSLTIRRDFNF